MSKDNNRMIIAKCPEELSMLGNTYKCKITGFKGVATGVCYYISGCTQILICGKTDKESNTPALWIDVQRLEQVKAKRIVLKNEETPGCDIPAPTGISKHHGMHI